MITMTSPKEKKRTSFNNESNHSDNDMLKEVESNNGNDVTQHGTYCDYCCCCEEDEFTTNDGDTIGACSECECTGCTNEKKCGCICVVEEAAGDRRASDYISKSKMIKHLLRLGNFDAQEWLERNKRLNRSGSFKFYNKSEEKQRKLALEHFKTTYQADFKDYGEIVRRASARTQRNSTGRKSSRTSSSSTRKPQPQREDNRENVEQNKVAGKPSTADTSGPRKEVDCICCCEAHELPHPSHRPISADSKPEKQTLDNNSNPKRVIITGCYPGGLPGNVDDLDRKYNEKMEKDAMVLENMENSCMNDGAEQRKDKDTMATNSQFNNEYQSYLLNESYQNSQPNVYFPEVEPATNTMNTNNSHHFGRTPSAPPFVSTQNTHYSYNISDVNNTDVISLDRYPNTINEPRHLTPKPNRNYNEPKELFQFAQTPPKVTIVNEKMGSYQQFQNETYRNSKGGGVIRKQPITSTATSFSHKKIPTQSDVQVKYMYPSLVHQLENHANKRIATVAGPAHNDICSKNITSNNREKADRSKVVVTNHRENYNQNIQCHIDNTVPRDRKQSLPIVHYKSHASPHFLITNEENIKSQRLSRFLEDVQRQLPVAAAATTSKTQSSTKLDNPNFIRDLNLVQKEIKRINDQHRPGASYETKNKDSQMVNKYPTYERQTANNALSDIKENVNMYQENDHEDHNHSVTISGSQASHFETTPTYRNSQIANKQICETGHRLSPNTWKNENSAGTTTVISTKSPHQFTDKTRKILAKYAQDEDSRRVDQSNFSNKAGAGMKKSNDRGVYRVRNNSTLTSNIVTFEEFSQKRIGGQGLTEQTQSVIQNVKTKSERLASKLISPTFNPQNGEKADDDDRELSDKSTCQTSKTKKEDPSEPIDEDNGNTNSIKNPCEQKKNSYEEFILNVRDEKPPKMSTSKKSTAFFIDGQGDAHTFDEKNNSDNKKYRIQELTAEVNVKNGTDLGSKTLTDSWSILFSETLAKIPQHKKNDQKDRVELENLMERLNSMSSELNSINQQLKTDVLQIPKTLKG